MQETTIVNIYHIDLFWEEPWMGSGNALELGFLSIFWSVLFEELCDLRLFWKAFWKKIIFSFSLLLIRWRDPYVCPDIWMFLQSISDGYLNNMSGSILKSGYWNTENNYLVKVIHYVLAKKTFRERLRKIVCLCCCSIFNFRNIFLIGIFLKRKHHTWHKIIIPSMYKGLWIPPEKFICQISFCWCKKLLWQMGGNFSTVRCRHVQGHSSRKWVSCRWKTVLWQFV